MSGKSGILHNKTFPAPIDDEWNKAVAQELKEQETEAKIAAEEKDKELCPHMKELISYCKAHKVYFGGCGDCGSAWLDCEICGLTVKNAHEAF